MYWLLLIYSNFYTNPSSQRDGKDWRTVARTLGYGEAGGLYAIVDDDNPVWEDIEYEAEDDYEFERRWKEDEKQNNEGVWTARDDKDLQLAGFDRQEKAVQVSLGLLYGLV